MNSLENYCQQARKFIDLLTCNITTQIGMDSFEVNIIERTLLLYWCSRKTNDGVINSFITRIVNNNYE